MRAYMSVKVCDTPTHMHAHTDICLQTYTYACRHMHTVTPKCPHMYISIHMHMHICTHMHTAYTGLCIRISI